MIKRNERGLGSVCVCVCINERRLKYDVIYTTQLHHL